MSGHTHKKTCMKGSNMLSLFLKYKIYIQKYMLVIFCLITGSFITLCSKNTHWSSVLECAEVFGVRRVGDKQRKGSER